MDFAFYGCLCVACCHVYHVLILNEMRLMISLYSHMLIDSYTSSQQLFKLSLYSVAIPACLVSCGVTGTLKRVGPPRCATLAIVTSSAHTEHANTKHGDMY